MSGSNGQRISCGCTAITPGRSSSWSTGCSRSRMLLLGIRIGQSRLPKSAGSTVWIPSTLRCSVTIEQATLEREIDQAYAERQLLGLDAWLDSLSGDDRQIIRLVFEDGYSYQAAAPMVNMSKPGLQYRINKICKNSIRV